MILLRIWECSSENDSSCWDTIRHAVRGVVGKTTTEDFGSLLIIYPYISRLTLYRFLYAPSTYFAARLHAASSAHPHGMLCRKDMWSGLSQVRAKNNLKFISKEKKGQPCYNTSLKKAKLPLQHCLFLEEELPYLFVCSRCREQCVQHRVCSTECAAGVENIVCSTASSQARLEYPLHCTALKKLPHYLWQWVEGEEKTEHRSGQQRQTWHTVRRQPLWTHSKSQRVTAKEHPSFPERTACP